MSNIINLNKPMKQRIDDFYGNSSVFRTNRFLVGFYGEYVRQAIKKLESDAKTERYNSNVFSGNQKLAFGEHIYLNALDRWKELHYNAEEEQVELKWTCESVTIPNTQVSIGNTKLLLDSVKSIKYPFITSGTDSIEKISINIIDTRDLMMYQFFNALLNRFFTPQILKPRSSFHKLGMYVAVLQEDFVKSGGIKENTEFRDADLDAVVKQIFEFNSIVIDGIPQLTFDQKGESILKYKINFSAPNTFQGSFKTSFKGLRNNTSDRQFLDLGVDQNTLLNNGTSYNRDNFEVSSLLSQNNGVYEKTLEPE